MEMLLQQEGNKRWKDSELELHPRYDHYDCSVFLLLFLLQQHSRTQTPAAS